ncbi:MAG: bifunctional precorrin-2 dehydrogenase/sirohydrochlorin ferrochelatase [Lachnospiraceae bacterium]|nr:bifunctional precorrin-2 dehydrogenase/sirohydrochlorin ferrochelatase [Lachnospiraceae bacterium]
MYFPLFVDLSQKEILIVGAGTIASRRVRSLCGFAGHMTVTAPEISGDISELASQYPITVCERRFEKTDLEEKDLVLAATDDLELNCLIVQMCRERGTPVNDCSDQSLCDFQFPSVLQQGDLVIGINASGKNHRLVKETRQKLQQFLENNGAARTDSVRTMTEKEKRNIDMSGGKFQ